MRRVVALVPAVAAILALCATVESSGPADDRSERTVTHVLNRLAFGPAQGDVEAVMRMGTTKWIERQLHPDGIATEAVDTRLAHLTTLHTDFAGLDRADIQARRRTVILELSEAKLLRAVYSERQLEEVLTDFWFNHFNVFARKGPTSVFLPAYERDVIRPHVLGRFRDLLGATAKSPAMLVYLDNWQSGRNGAVNENYARELLELHTLGVDGGYTQRDIVEVARAFSGWSIRRLEEPGFRFAPRLHQRGDKTVLGTRIADGGVAEGERVLDILARHPATATRIAFKLAQRLVSDTPPAALVDRAAARFRNTDGDLREVVRAIVTSPEFFSPDAYRAQVKTPFEFVVSALRATGAEITTARPVVRALASMGMPLYLCQPPTGYDDTADAWVSSGSLVARINFALDLANNRLPGIRMATRRNATDIGSAEFQRQ